jgi:hypothetical protein
MLEELDVVILGRQFETLPAGTKGVVVLLHDDACEVEFEGDVQLTRAVPVDALRKVGADA